MAAVIPFLAPVAMGISAVGSVISGISQNNQSKAQARMMENNARAAQAEAAQNAALSREKYRRLAESQKAGFAASGITLDSGSVLETLVDTEGESEVAARQILYGGQMEAANWNNQATSARAAGQNALAGGILGGVSKSASLLGDYFKTSPSKPKTATYTGKEMSALGSKKW